MRYPIPAERHRTHEEVDRSRFVATLAPAATVDEAQAFVASVRAEFADATHHCWAYVVGAPGSTACVGMSDDGEPHGTAGRPMLTALLYGGVGDVAVLKRLAAAYEAETLGEDYGADVSYTLRLPVPNAEPFSAALRDATRGAAVVEAA